MGFISEKLLYDVETCKKCNTIIGHKKFPKDSHGNLKARYIIVSEAPGNDSVNNYRKYWMGAGGKLLRSCMEEELEAIFYLTDMVKCWPNKNGKNRKPYDTEVINCSRFLDRELNELQPDLIIALGKTVGEYLLKRPLNLREDHGKIYELGSYKILILYHPSNIDFHYSRDQYKQELRNLFNQVKSGKVQLNKIISASKDEDKSKSEITTGSDQKMEDLKSIATFLIPAPGNSITEEDIKKGQIRITVDFKNRFPSESKSIYVIVNNASYPINFRHRGRRSHILHFGHHLVNLLGINAGDSLKFEMINQTTFRVSKA